MAKTEEHKSTDLQWGISNFKTAAALHGKMDVDIKKKLVEALRSGDYAQTRGYLRLNNAFDDRPAGFCCLGVFSEVAMASGVAIHTTEDQSGIVKYHGGTDEYGMPEKSTAFLLGDVSKWLGWETDSLLDSSLMTINDNGGSFALIADLIEEHL